MSDRRPAPQQLAQAYEAFLTTDLSLDDIALSLGINRMALAKAAREGKWRDRKREVELELFKSADDKYRRFLIEQRMPTVERHLKVAKAIEVAIDDTLAKVQSGEISVKSLPSTLKQLADALRGAADVSARAAAISDTPFSDATAAAAGAPQKTPLVIINAAPQAPSNTVHEDLRIVDGTSVKKTPFNTEELD